jgi:glycosyltransferase involved in cell wall biosynthesis
VSYPDIIIAAHNEQDTVGAVIAAARDSLSVGRIIVVSDASTDRTWAAAQEADVLTHSRAKDKGSAIAAGLHYVTTEDTVLLDADIIGLLPAHVRVLATHPPSGGQVVGVRSDRGWSGGLPSITGERRVPTDLLSSVPLVGAGWRTETLINAAVGRAGLPWRAVRLVGVINPTKMGRDPFGWLKEAGTVAGTALAHAPELVAYMRHPAGTTKMVASDPAIH